jgi:hypothetical protein
MAPLVKTLVEATLPRTKPRGAPGQHDLPALTRSGNLARLQSGQTAQRFPARDTVPRDVRDRGDVDDEAATAATHMRHHGKRIRCGKR